MTRPEFDALMAQHGIVFVDEAAWRLAALVARYEREACAKVCDAIHAEYEGEDVEATWCAAAIRARGQS